MSLDSTSTNELEDILMLWEFGKWAKNTSQGPVLAMPSWVREIKSRPDEEVSLRRYIGDIDEDYALELDRHISELRERNRGVIYLYYVQNRTWRDVAKILKSSVRTVRTERDIAISILAGRLNKA